MSVRCFGASKAKTDWGRRDALELSVGAGCKESQERKASHQSFHEHAFGKQTAQCPLYGTRLLGT